MPIRIEHGKPSTLITAAQLARDARRQEELQKTQLEFDYRQRLREQDMAIDLQMQERAKAWEIEKMELRSRLDFQRKEQLRQRKLDSIDSAMQQIDKEVLAGRMSEKEAYPLRQKLEFDKMGVDVPISMLKPEEERYGVEPFWAEWLKLPKGSPKREYADRKLLETDETGVRPHYYDPDFITKFPKIARQEFENRGIFFDSDKEWEEFRKSIMGTPTPKVPVDTERIGKQVRVISPTGEEGTIPVEDLEEALAEGYTQALGDVIPPTTEDVMEQLEAGERKFYKPSLRTFATMSPLRYLMERRKAKKIVR